MKLHLGAFDQILPGWINTDVTPHLWIARAPGAARLACLLGLISRERLAQHERGIFAKLRRLDVRRRFPYPDDSVTAVYSSHMLEHIPRSAAAFCLKECHRVLKPGGLLALWCYQRLAIEPALDAIVEDFYAGLLDSYWPPERRLVESGYRGLDFPFAELPAPAMTMTAIWTLDQLLGYFSTWSALKAYQQATGHDPLPDLGERLAGAWISLDGAKTIKWPLSLRLGRP
mgnify:CR=1 FL=1